MRHKHHKPHHGHLPTVSATVLLINYATNESQEEYRSWCKVEELIYSFHKVFMP